MVETAAMEDFAHLEREDDGAAKVAEARRAVGALKKHVDGFNDLRAEQERAEERQRVAHELAQQRQTTRRHSTPFVCGSPSSSVKVPRSAATRWSVCYVTCSTSSTWTRALLSNQRRADRRPLHFRVHRIPARGQVAERMGRGPTARRVQGEDRPEARQHPRPLLEHQRVFARRGHPPLHQPARHGPGRRLRPHGRARRAHRPRRAPATEAPACSSDGEHPPHSLHHPGDLRPPEPSSASFSSNGWNRRAGVCRPDKGDDGASPDNS